MKLHYKVENLRSIKSMDFVQLKPITVFLGKNNSGKSSLLMVFPLLRQSVKDIDNQSISWNGQYVDYGSFKSSLSDSSENKEISFSFKFEELTLHNKIQMINNENSTIQKTINEIDYTIIFGDYGNGTIKKLLLNLHDHNINVIITFAEDGCHIEKFDVNGVNIINIECSEELQSMNMGLYFNNVFPRFRINYSSPDFFAENNGPFLGEFFNDIYKLLRDKLKINKDSFTEFNRHAHYEIINILKHEKLENESINLLIQSSDSDIFKNFYENLLTSNYMNTLEIINFYCSIYWVIMSANSISTILFKIAQDSTYIGPSRIESERYYLKRKVDTSRISHNGENLPMVLLDLIDNNAFDRFSSWIEKVIGTKIFLEKDSNTVNILLERDNSKVNLKDSGYGISQALPILTQLWMISQHNIGRNEKQNSEYLFDSSEMPQIVTIEHPEAHLHPAFNKKFIDALVSTVKTCTKKSSPIFIVETHSKGIIDRLGELIVRNEISRDDVNIVLFENDTEQHNRNNSSIHKSFFNKKGMLEDWPLGFMGY